MSTLSDIFIKLRKSGKTINLREIETLYYVELMSLNEIAKKYNCSRQNIYQILKRRGIQTRDKTSASELAYKRGKRIRSVTDESGIKKDIVMERVQIDESFFKQWSPDMAYVLGVLYTDGNLQPERRYKRIKQPPRLTLAQKTPELLEKVLSLMRCTAKIHKRKQRESSGEIKYFHVSDSEIYGDLQRLGLTPRKSLTVTFPSMPFEVIRHFIRGCWDGDGTVYLENNQLNKAKASLVSGSRDFIQGMIDKLELLGMRKRKIYTSKNGKSFYFRYHGEQCAKLYHIFYDGVPEIMYLRRKFDIFEKIARYYEKQPEFAGV